MSRSLPPDPACPICSICSKPVRSTGFILSAHGEVFHIRCRSQQLQLRAIEQADRAKAARNLAAGLVEETARRHAARPRRRHIPGWPASSTCPLCAYPATLTDWRPEGADWIVVEQCPCAGFFVWAPILERVRTLPVQDRQNLARRVRGYRLRHEAWLTTTDGTIEGLLVVRTDRPDRLDEGDTKRVRQIVLDDLRTAERDLTALQETQPDPRRARDLDALREAITALVRLMPERSGASD
jgi:hypothetical protein